MKESILKLNSRYPVGADAYYFRFQSATQSIYKTNDLKRNKSVSIKIKMSELKEFLKQEPVKKITEEKVTEKSQNFLVKNLKTLKIEISIQVIEKIIRIKNHLIKKRV